jgi:hypothetical protein
MTRALTALLLLVTFGLGVLLGPHSCEAGQTHQESAMSSCHGPQPAAAGLQVGTGAPQEDEGTGCGTFCQHACHMTAVTEAVRVAFAIAPGSEAVFESSGRGLSRFAHPIDHIPLV